MRKTMLLVAVIVATLSFSSVSAGNIHYIFLPLVMGVAVPPVAPTPGVNIRVEVVYEDGSVAASVPFQSEIADTGEMIDYVTDSRGNAYIAYLNQTLYFECDQVFKVYAPEDGPPTEVFPVTLVDVCEACGCSSVTSPNRR